jgi:hypothetical protein
MRIIEIPLLLLHGGLVREADADWVRELLADLNPSSGK